MQLNDELLPTCPNCGATFDEEDPQIKKLREEKSQEADVQRRAQETEHEQHIEAASRNVPSVLRGQGIQSGVYGSHGESPAGVPAGSRPEDCSEAADRPGVRALSA
jgi:hypothetical protein